MSSALTKSFGTTILAIYAIAIALWVGGLVVLGVIVAPTVFGIVPAPASADAMTVVFRRFDMIAISCAAISLIAEALIARAHFTGLPMRPTTSDLVRAGSVVIAAALAILEGAYLSPTIQALHNAGAIRNMNPAGIELERLHKIAEMSGKSELLLLLVVIVLLIVRVRRTLV